MDSASGVLQKVFRCQEGDAFTVATQHVITDHLALAQDNHVVRLNRSLLGVYQIFSTPLDTHPNQQTAHFVWF